MKKLFLSNYEVEIEFEGKKVKKPFQVKESILEILFHPSLKLTGRELLKQNDLAEKIEKCNEDFILLETEEHNKILRALELTTGLGRNAVEFVKRILEAPDVKVEEKR
jgi:tRNA U34 5-methylaminomethyl-2-thiouridine-forming methyltransferase MnmC